MGVRRLVATLCTSVLVLGSGFVLVGDSGAAAPWTTTPLPFATAGPIQGSFSAVSCQSATECVAVGKATLPGGLSDTGAFVANLVSGAWIQGLLPLPAGASSASLAAVTCTSTACQAVGTYTASQTHALIETFSGGTWTATTGVDPTGVVSASLSGVSCVSRTACTAVGNDSSGVFVVGLTGTTWSANQLSMPAGVTEPNLYAVSCTGAETCDAVGSSATSSDYAQPLVAVEEGGSWTASNDVSEPGALLTSVACGVDGTCEAGAAAGYTGFFESFPVSGASFTHGAGAGAQISSIWCASGKPRCTAWGVSASGTIVIQSLSSGSWTSEPTNGLPDELSYGTCTAPGTCVALEALAPSAAGVLTQATTSSPWIESTLHGPPNGSVRQVSCTVKLCAGVGSYFDDTGVDHIMIESLVHGSWVEQTLSSVPADLSDPPSISCQTKTCVLVDGDTASVNSGSGWTTTTLPEPVGDTQGVDVDSVSCVSTQWCVAVGLGASVIETYSDGTWTAKNAPLPSGADGYLLTVSCASDTSCVAVGAGSPSVNTGIQSLVETFSGKGWSPSFLPPVSGATYGSLGSVSCPTTTTCTAVGLWYPDFGGPGDPLVATMSGSSWSESTNSPIGGPYADLTGVGCAASDTCFAIETSDAPGTMPPILQQLGVGPVVVPLPAGTGASSVSPEAISCVSGSEWCTLAGFYDVPVRGSPGPATYPMIASSGAPPITFTSAAKATAPVGEPFSFEVETASKPGDAITANGLPAGFTLTDSGNHTGIISGTATAAEIGTSQVTVSAENGVAPAASQILKLKIIS